MVHKSSVPGLAESKESKVNEAMSGVGGSGPSSTAGKDEVEVYTYVKHDISKKKWTWHQEVNDKILPDSRSSCPDSAPCWMYL